MEADHIATLWRLRDRAQREWRNEDRPQFKEDRKKEYDALVWILETLAP